MLLRTLKLHANVNKLLTERWFIVSFSFLSFFKGTLELLHHTTNSSAKVYYGKMTQDIQYNANTSTTYITLSNLNEL